MQRNDGCFVSYAEDTPKEKECWKGVYQIDCSGLPSLGSVGLLLGPAAAQAETGAPAVHWGALAYPDRSPILAIAGNFNRFTEFNSEGQRFNNINETMGFNFASISWTEHRRN
ncbi:MAG TPA: hypothetical protein VNK46_13555 [Nitrospiraceae bacterium]|nr:hypothetical protein [Nitrospiraceae bacterium]